MIELPSYEKKTGAINRYSGCSNNIISITELLSTENYRMFHSIVR